MRDAETETVPSRWLNRIQNLMQGASADSAAALAAMKDRGRDWLALAGQLDQPAERVTPARRPSPAPPLDQRPDSLSVTQVEKLIRDPYAIYARKVLRLKPLDPLRQMPDAPLRGTILHDLFRRFVQDTISGLPDNAEEVLLDLADEVLEDQAPWPAARRLWRARIARIAPWFISTEQARRAVARPYLLEAEGRAAVGLEDFTLVGTADRIDLTPDGEYLIYDYKTGSAPSPKQEKAFNKQLWLEAVMAEKGGFGEPRPTRQVAYIALGGGGKITPHDITEAELIEIEEGFAKRLEYYRSEANGYTSRRAMEEVKFDGDYDHLARFGEWDTTQKPIVVRVGR
jgi:RecB family exonuclease